MTVTPHDLANRTLNKLNPNGLFDPGSFGGILEIILTIIGLIQECGRTDEAVRTIRRPSWRDRRTALVYVRKTLPRDRRSQGFFEYLKETNDIADALVDSGSELSEQEIRELISS